MDGPRMSLRRTSRALSSVETQSRRATVLDSLLSDLSSHLEFIVLLLCLKASYVLLQGFVFALFVVVSFTTLGESEFKNQIIPFFLILSTPHAGCRWLKYRWHASLAALLILCY